MNQIGLRHLMTFRPMSDARTAHNLGVMPTGFTRRVVFVTGGSFEGERLKGRVLPGGGDFPVIRPDGAMHLDVRLLLETDQGEPIYLTYGGRRHAAPEVMARYRTTEPVPPEQEYFRIVAQFECASPRLAWLNDVLAVGTGERRADGVVYEIFEIV